MAAHAEAPVVSVFPEETTARKAMEDLMGAGFSGEQIHYSVRKGTKIRDTLRDMGLSSSEADRYNSQFEAGHTVVAVEAPRREREALEILKRDGGYDFNVEGMAGTSGAAGVAGTATSQPGYMTAKQAPIGPMGVDEREVDQNQRLKLREEQLQVEKQKAQAGEVRLSKNVVEEPQSIDVPVRHEEAFIETRPGTGQVTNEPIGQGETISVPLSQEQVIVQKQTVDRGEVGIGKREVEEKQRVSDTVKREEPRIETQGDVDVRKAKRRDKQ